MTRWGVAFLTACALFCSRAAEASAPLPKVRVLLIGDSTLARGSGYGDALCARFVPEVSCVNLAKGGRSSRTYREEGSWADALKRLAQPEGAAATYVLVQFGHNDQGGSERSTTLEQFTGNLGGYVQDVRVAATSAWCSTRRATRRRGA